jgi:glycosyltransferase involved in cell wall biosynthesis
VRERSLLIGPDPGRRQAGGVVTHMRVLTSLDAFRDADVFDLGSVHGTTGVRRIAAAAAVLRRLPALRRRMRTRRYDNVLVQTTIVQAAFVKLLLTLAVMPPLRGGAVRVFFHGGGRFDELALLRIHIVRRLAARILRRVHAAYFLSASDRRGYACFFPGLSAACFRNYSHADTVVEPERRTAGPLRLLFVGRVVRRKGVFDVVEALHEAVRGGCDCTLTVVGDGPDLPRLRQHAAAVPDRVRFTGYLQGASLESEYRSADALVLPTALPEGMPYVMIEAMRAGLPVVATRCGALRRFVVDGETGFSVEPGDVASLVDAFRRLRSGPALRERMGARNQRVFRELLNRSAAEHFYTGLLGARSGVRQ